MIMSYVHVWKHFKLKTTIFQSHAICFPFIPVPTNTVYSQRFLNTSVFNLTEVCWTVCFLTYTTCSTVHIHSFHKKYIFVYTAFTISYNRAVAGTSVRMDAFFFFFLTKYLQCPQNTSNPVIIQQTHPIIMIMCSHLSMFALPQLGAIRTSHLIILCSCLSRLFRQRPRPCRVIHTIGLVWRHCRK